MMQFKSNVGFPFVINTTSNLSKPMQEKFQRAADIASYRLEENRLWDFISDYNYTIKYYRGFWRWRRVVKTRRVNGFHVDHEKDIFDTANVDILNIVQRGAELQLGNDADGEADIFWQLDNRNKRGVVGYTYRNTVWQYTYRNWAENMTDEELAGHLVHEWLHKIGGEHAFKIHALRRHTFTYACGYYVAGRFY